MISAILTDIEGTTSSIRFVKEVLFPYAAERLPAFVRAHCTTEPVRSQLRAVAQHLDKTLSDDRCTDLGGDSEPDQTINLEPVIGQLLDWIATDTKATPLKALQGMIWREGYEQGDYQAHFYADAVERLTAWHQRGIPVFVYSSGSVQAQDLFFHYSRFGDLRPLVSGYFDTATGPKQDPASYSKISARLGLPPDEILFLSDTAAELDAARDAGLATVRVQRPEDATAVPQVAARHEHQVVESFADLND